MFVRVRRALALTGTVLLLATTAVVILDGPALAGPDKGLCNMQESRGKIPSDFPLASCFDGEYLYVLNKLSVPVMIFADGGGTPVASGTRGAPVPSQILVLGFLKNFNLLAPGFQAKIHIGKSAATVRTTRASTKTNEAYVLASAIWKYFPMNPGGTVADLILELVDVGDQYRTCVRRNGWWGDVGCTALVVRNIAFAIGRAGTNLFARGLPEAILQFFDGSSWLADDLGSVAALNSAKPFAIAAAPAPPVVPAPSTGGGNTGGSGGSGSGNPPPPQNNPPPPQNDPPPPPPQPTSAVVTIQNKHLEGAGGLAEDATPSYLSSQTVPSCAAKGCKIGNTDMWSDDQLTVTCWTDGTLMTNENRSISSDDNNPNRVDTTRWYRGERNGQTGYISQIYIVAGNRGDMGMPHC